MKNKVKAMSSRRKKERKERVFVKREKWEKKKEKKKEEKNVKEKVKKDIKCCAAIVASYIFHKFHSYVEYALKENKIKYSLILFNAMAQQVKLKDLTKTEVLENRINEILSSYQDAELRLKPDAFKGDEELVNFLKEANSRGACVSSISIAYFLKSISEYIGVHSEEFEKAFHSSCCTKVVNSKSSLLDIVNSIIEELPTKEENFSILYKNINFLLKRMSEEVGNFNKEIINQIIDEINQNKFLSICMFMPTTVQNESTIFLIPLFVNKRQRKLWNQIRIRLKKKNGKTKEISESKVIKKVFCEFISRCIYIEWKDRFRRSIIIFYLKKNQYKPRLLNTKIYQQALLEFAF